MSNEVEAETSNEAATAAAVELTIQPRVRSLGEFDVRRVLPSPKRRMVGPFAFLDHMGPAVFPPGHGIAVRPHPHIGLATITYLFEGEIMHRDSLGVRQLIQAGAVNLMTAGRGIVHSERASDDLAVTSRLHGIQSWIALPQSLEEMEPTFLHYPASALPQMTIDGCAVRVIMGGAYGMQSPVLTYSPTLYFEATLAASAKLEVLDEAAERAVYVVSGRVDIGGESYGEGTLAVLRGGASVLLEAAAEAESRVIVIGGTSVGPRHIWWNFVSSSEARIERAKRDWTEMRMGSVPGDDEYIPLPTN
ncbi:MAG TPA: pirin family protein [Gammaproteobacteria bacterium]|nr:pirin family protein [Gammaproteobacteria bacterium]